MFSRESWMVQGVSSRLAVVMAASPGPLGKKTFRPFPLSLSLYIVCIVKPGHSKTTPSIPLLPRAQPNPIGWTTLLTQTESQVASIGGGDELLRTEGRGHSETASTMVDRGGGYGRTFGTGVVPGCGLLQHLDNVFFLLSTISGRKELGDRHLGHRFVPRQSSQQGHARF